jgi:hypothetical protein
MKKPPKMDANLHEGVARSGAGMERTALLAAPRLIVAFRRLKRFLKRMANGIEAHGDRVLEAEEAVGEIVDLLSDVPEVFHGARGRRSPAEQRVMRAEAEAGVASVQIRPQADGAGEVSVNGRKSFRLAPNLRILLAVLIAPGPCADDGLIGWQANAKVATALNKHTGGTLSPSAVPRLVYRLRNAFRDAGENWYLIQTNRRRGVRVALRG